MHTEEFFVARRSARKKCQLGIGQPAIHPLIAYIQCTGQVRRCGRTGTEEMVKPSTRKPLSLWDRDLATRQQRLQRTGNLREAMYSSARASAQKHVALRLCTTYGTTGGPRGQHPLVAHNPPFAGANMDVAATEEGGASLRGFDWGEVVGAGRRCSEALGPSPPAWPLGCRWGWRATS